MKTRAIILAAGMGTRLRPLSYAIPKSLVPVNGKPMLEQQIEFLKEKGIDDIIVTTGYLHEKFEYLKDKYHVKLVHNDKYDKFNNIYTMYLVREHFKKGTYVVEADIHLTKNIFLENPKSSFYMSARKPHFKKEWIFDVDAQGRIHDFHVDDGHDQYIMCGVSYWTEKDAAMVVAKLEEIVKMDPMTGLVKEDSFKDLFWDDVVREVLYNQKELSLYLAPLEEGDVYEIDSLDEWRDIQTKLTKPSVASFMLSYGLFRQLHDNYLERNRGGQDAKIQEVYDKRFGLVVRV